MSDDAPDAASGRTHSVDSVEAFEDVDQELDTMWTAQALEAYQAQAAHLAQLLAAHAELVSTRVGRHRELLAYFQSADRLRRAVDVFADAEYGWCGSFPLRRDDLDDETDLEESEGVQETAEGGALTQQAGVLTVLGRHDYVITDAAALVEHGRAAYLQHWDKETAQDAQERVQDPSVAVAEILHGASLSELEGVPGLQLTTWISQLIQHEGSDEDEIAQDPFGINGQT